VAEIRSTLPLRGSQDVDVLIVGGGILGASVFRHCAQMGLRTLLLEKGDFASGTSSRSSKLVHGGLHYLSQVQLRLAYESCRDRTRLARSAPGLVDVVPFRLPFDSMGGVPTVVAQVGVRAYERMGGRLPGAADLDRPVGPWVDRIPGMNYSDGVTDDAGMVLRVLREGCAAGGHARNFARVDSLLRDPEGTAPPAGPIGSGAPDEDRDHGPEQGPVRGATVTDLRTGSTCRIQARVVVNATGAWADRLRGTVGGARRLSFLRGSHLVLRREALPLNHALVGRHPTSGQPIYLVPWAGVTLVGSTAVQHLARLDEPPVIDAAEAAYLLDWVNLVAPEARVGPRDVLSTFSGLRAIVDGGQALSHDASRAALIVEEAGLLTITGGKLTLFPSLAEEVTQRIARRLDRRLPRLPRRPVLDPVRLPEDGLPVSEETALRILARYGEAALEDLLSAGAAALQALPGLSASLWEVGWAAREGGVRHLDDLLLRRLRIGLTDPGATARALPALREPVRAHLGWEEARWDAEAEAYRELIRSQHSLPGLADEASESGPGELAVGYGRMRTA
jgi:glycerol-3-phosphate dehydrogenase